ncbi:MAG: MucR family transcriptional regulator, partial [Mesorhizobium sp.]
SEYRAKWGLLADYRMVAPNYAAARSALVKTWARPQTERAGTPAPTKRTRKKVEA